MALSRSYRRDEEDERDGGRIKGRHMVYDTPFFFRTRVLASLDRFDPLRVVRRAVNAERHTRSRMHAQPYLEISIFCQTVKRETNRHTNIIWNFRKLLWAFPLNNLKGAARMDHSFSFKATSHSRMVLVVFV